MPPYDFDAILNSTDPLNSANAPEEKKKRADEKAAVASYLGELAPSDPFDTILSQYDPLAPTKSPPKVVTPSRGVIADTGAALAAGTADLAELLARAYRTGNIEEEEQGVGDAAATWVIKQKEDLEKKYPGVFAASKESQAGGPRGWWYGGVRSAIPSIGAGAPGAIAGSVGGVPGAVAGFAASGGTVFGLAEYDQFKDEVIKYNKEHPDDAIPKDVWQDKALMSAFAQGGLEAVNNAVEALTFRLGGVALKGFKGAIKKAAGEGVAEVVPSLTIGETLRPTAKEALKTFAKGQAVMQPAEISTEMAQDYISNQQRREAGLPQEQTPWEAAVSAIGPTAVMTALFGVGGHVYNKAQRNAIAKALENGDVPVETRFQAAHLIAKELETYDKANGTELATKWAEAAVERIAKMEAIPLDEDVYTMPTRAEAEAKIETAKAAEADLTKFEERGKTPIEEIAEEPRPKEDKEVGRLFAYGTHEYIKGKFIASGMTEERAQELANQVMGAKGKEETVETPAPVVTEDKTILYDAQGNPVIVDKKSIQGEKVTSGIIPEATINEQPIRTPSQKTIEKPIPSKYEDVVSKTGQPYSTKAGATLSLKSRGMGDTHVAVPIADNQWVGRRKDVVRTTGTLLKIPRAQQAAANFTQQFTKGLRYDRPNITGVESAEQVTQPETTPGPASGTGAVATTPVKRTRARKQVVTPKVESEATTSAPVVSVDEQAQVETAPVQEPTVKERLTAQKVKVRLQAGEDVPVDEVKKFHTLDIRWSKDETGKWVEKEPNYKTAKTLTEEEREARADQRAREKAAKTPSKPAADFTTQLEKAEKHRKSLQTKLAKETDPDKKEDIQDEIDSTTQDIRVLSTRVNKQASINKIDYFGGVQVDKATREKTGHPLETEAEYQPVEVVENNIDKHSTLVDGVRRLRDNIPGPAAMIQAIRTMINHRVHVEDGGVNLAVTGQHIQQLIDGYNAGRLDNYFGKDKDGKQSFAGQLAALANYYKKAVDHLFEQMVTEKQETEPTAEERVDDELDRLIATQNDELGDEEGQAYISDLIGRESFTKEEVEQLIRPLLVNWKNRPPVRVFRNLREMIEETGINPKASGVDANDMMMRGVALYLNGKVYLFSDLMAKQSGSLKSLLRSRNEVIGHLLHETMGHYGIRGVLGEQRVPELLKLWDAVKDTPEMQQVASRYKKLDISKDEDRALAVEEALSEIVKRPQVERTLWQKIKDWFKGWADRYGFITTNKTGDEQVKSLLADARRYVIDPPGSFLPARFANATGQLDTADKAPVFFSKLEDVVANDKNLPKKVQSLKNYLAKFVKPSELQWMDLDGFLKGKQTVTREELLKHIKANTIDVQEVIKGGPKRELTNQDVNQMLAGEWDENRLEPDGPWGAFNEGEIDEFVLDLASKNIPYVFEESVTATEIDNIFKLNREYLEPLIDASASDPEEKNRLINQLESINAQVDRDIADYYSQRTLDIQAGQDELQAPEGYVAQNFANNGPRFDPTMQQVGNQWDVYIVDTTQPGQTIVDENLLDSRAEAEDWINERLRYWNNWHYAGVHGPDGPHPLNQEQATGGATRYDQYTLPGGENYRELLLTWGQPRQGGLQQGDHYIYGVIENELDDEGGWLAQIEVTDATEENIVEPTDSRVFPTYEAAEAWAQEEVNRLNQGQKNDPSPARFSSGHWTEADILSHVRFKDRTDADGKKILFIEEIQSDWHQAGKKQGYKTNDVKTYTADELLEAKEFYGIRDDDWEQMDNDQRQHYAEERFTRSYNQGVANAPFKDTWHELAMKRMIRWAAEHGYDGVAWTTGKQQADRYNLARYYTNIKLISQIPGQDRSWRLQATVLDGGQVIDRYVDNKEDIAALVGDEVADRLLALKPKEKVSDLDWIEQRRNESGDMFATEHEMNNLRENPDMIPEMRNYNDRADITVRELTDLNIETGGEGMKKFYDELLPGFAKRYLQQWGVKPETVSIGLTEQVHKHGENPLGLAPETRAEIERLTEIRNNMQEALDNEEVTNRERWQNQMDDYSAQISTLENLRVPTDEYVNETNTSQQPGFYLNDKMKQDVLLKGQPAWSMLSDPKKQKILNAASKRFGVTNTFSPGYSHWMMPNGQFINNKQKFIHGDVQSILEQNHLYQYENDDVLGTDNFKAIMPIFADATGSIRFRGWSSGDVSLEMPEGFQLSQMQITNLRKIVEYGQSGNIWYDVTDMDGNILRSGETHNLSEVIRELRPQKEVEGQFSIIDGPLNKLKPQSTKREVRDIFSDEALSLLKTISAQSPGNLPHMSFLERLLRSPEWYLHPVLKRIVKHAIDRHDNYYTLFNNFNDLKEPVKINGNQYNTIIGATNALRKESPEQYAVFQKVVDEGDTFEWKAGYSEDSNVTYEEHLRRINVPEQVQALYRLHRGAYDKALDLLTAPMKKLVDQIEADAKEKGQTPKFPVMQVMDQSGERKSLTLKEAVQHMNQWRGTYAPRLRDYGGWAVKGKKGERDYRYHRTNRWGAERLAARLRREGYTAVTVGEKEQMPEVLYQNLRLADTAKAIETALNHMKVKDTDAQVKFHNELIKDMADVIRMRGFRSSMIKRREGAVIKGYIEDPNERFVKYIMSISAGMAKAETARTMMQELTFTYETKDGKKERTGGIDPEKEPRVYEVAQKYIEEQLRNADYIDRVIGNIKGVATFKYLGLNPRSMLVNILAVPTTVPPAIRQYALGGKGNFATIGRAMAKASVDFAKTMSGGKLSNVQEQEFIDEIHEKGYAIPQYTREAMGTIERGFGSYWQKALGASMKLFQVTEEWNRGVTMLAAYRLAKEANPKMSEEEARALAHEASNKAHGIYGKATLPEFAQGTGWGAKMGQLVYTYQKFSHNYLQMLYDLGFKKHDITGFLWALLSPIVLGGAMVIPFKGVVFAVAGAILKAAGYDDDPEKWVWDHWRKIVGKTGEKITRHGVIGAAGVDVSGSLSIGVGIPQSGYDIFGVVGGVAQDITTASDFLSTGQAGRAAERVVPTGIANFLRAYREMNTGVVTTRGDRVFNDDGTPFRPSGVETALRAGGARTANLATLQERTWEAKVDEKRFQAHREKIAQRYKAYLSDPKANPKDFQKVMDEVAKYNNGVIRSGKFNIPYITKESMRQQAKEMFAPNKKEFLRLAD